MLTWTERTDGWYANGFRIELAAPFRWLLLANGDSVAAVSLEETPLAVSRTLTEAKREAELLVVQRERAELRKRHLVIRGLILGLSTFLLADLSTATLGLLIVLVVLATRSLGVVAGTILWRVAGPQPEVFYQ